MVGWGCRAKPSSAQPTAVRARWPQASGRGVNRLGLGEAHSAGVLPVEFEEVGGGGNELPFGSHAGENIVERIG
jgi:hypothetical protein